MVQLLFKDGLLPRKNQAAGKQGMAGAGKQSVQVGFIRFLMDRHKELFAQVDPASQAVGTTSTGWISAGSHHNLLALIQSGALGTNATLDAKLSKARQLKQGMMQELLTGRIRLV